MCRKIGVLSTITIRYILYTPLFLVLAQNPAHQSYVEIENIAVNTFKLQWITTLLSKATTSCSNDTHRSKTRRPLTQWKNITQPCKVYRTCLHDAGKPYTVVYILFACHLRTSISFWCKASEDQGTERESSSGWIESLSFCLPSAYDAGSKTAPLRQ